MSPEDPTPREKVFRAQRDLVNWFEVWGFPLLLWFALLAGLMRELLGHEGASGAAPWIALIGLLVVPLGQCCWALEIRIRDDRRIEVRRTWNRIEFDAADVYRFEGLGLFRNAHQMHVKGRWIFLPSRFGRIAELTEALRAANPWIEIEGRLDP